ncbi:para-nitrobenzyl esterase [Spirosomataceae bacterium TFI 002]|nr:para-nitrobenzyl esterase [Spirosomataceae bacterium TFI 002]
MNKSLTYTLLIIFLAAISTFSQENVVKTDKGWVEGMVEKDILTFKGIPFAAPPVGELRWKKPIEHEPWSGKLECKEFSASPIQNKPTPFYCWSEEFIAPPEPLSEDCLYLNIWTKGNKGGRKKPVVMWIYGGGFVSGSSACSVYDGTAYAEQDVVFVSINYRVGIFGFLAHPELSAESNGEASGNYALLDQIQGLKWIQKNIDAFGGDPNNVTIIGQSAGSFSVQALVASPLAKGLFNKAIGHSGGLLGTARGVSLADAEATGNEIVEKIDAGNISQLRELSAEELFNKYKKAGSARMAPVLDGYVLPSNLEEHFKAGHHNDVPFITGWVTGDGSLGDSFKITPEQYKENIEKKYGVNSSEYLKQFPGKTLKEVKKSSEKAGMINFAVNTAMLWSKYNKSPSYIYEFDHVPTDKPDFPNYGAFHTADVPFALHTLNKWDRPWQKSDLDMENAMSSYWINFIKTGNPNSKNLASWPEHGTSSKAVLMLKSTIEARNEYLQQELDLIYTEK